MKKILLTFIITLTALIIAPTVSLAEDEPAGKITVASGNIHSFHRETGRILKAEKGDNVYPGDSIRTKSNSFAEITLNDGSVLKIAPNTRIKISEFTLNSDNKRESAVIQLFRGKVRAAVSKVKSLSGFLKASFGSSGGNFAISTPSAVMGVKGTEFIAIHEKGRTSVFVDSGEVVYWNVSNPDVDVTVPGGHYSHTVAGSAPTKPMPYTMAHATVNQSMTSEMSATKFSTYGAEDSVKNTRGSKEESGEQDVTETNTGNMLTRDDSRESFDTVSSTDAYRMYLQDETAGIVALHNDAIIDKRVILPTIGCYSNC